MFQEFETVRLNVLTVAAIRPLADGRLAVFAWIRVAERHFGAYVGSEWRGGIVTTNDPQGDRIVLTAGQAEFGPQPYPQVEQMNEVGASSVARPVSDQQAVFRWAFPPEFMRPSSAPIGTSFAIDGELYTIESIGDDGAFYLIHHPR